MRRSEDTRKVILDAGGEILYSRGYNATGVKDIVDAAGVPKGSFYNYFESKEAFALDVLDGIADAQLKRIEAQLSDSSRPPLERIRRFFEVMIDEIKAGGQFTRGCLIGNLSQEMADHSRTFATRLDRWFGRYTHAIAACLREAQQVGDLDPQEDADALAAFIFNSWEGTLLRMKASKSASPLDTFQRFLTDRILG